VLRGEILKDRNFEIEVLDAGGAEVAAHGRRAELRRGRAASGPRTKRTW
jgi:hypothetical protein